MLEFTSSNDDPAITELSKTLRRFLQPRYQLSREAELGFDRSFFEESAKLGLCGMAIDEAYGGSGLSSFGIASAAFELARADLGPAVYLSVHAMVSRLIARSIENTPAEHLPLREELLKDLALGKFLAAFALTEPQAGSDAAALSTRAEKTSGGYLLSGEKCYITGGPVADLFLVFARSDGPGADGISAFIVPADSKGLSSGKAERKMGCIGAPISSLTFDNCFVPESALVGRPGSGYRTALAGLSGGRVTIAAAACGLASRAISIAGDYLKERKQFGKSLAEFQGLQFMLADAAMELRASVLLTRDAANKLDQGTSARTAAATAKCFATDAAMRITTDAVQLLGGAGYLEDYIVERLMRDAKMLQIVEGTNQIQRILIARDLLGERK